MLIKAENSNLNIDNDNVELKFSKMVLSLKLVILYKKFYYDNTFTNHSSHSYITNCTG